MPERAPMTVVMATERLYRRRAALIIEIERLTKTRTEELRSANAQLAAIEGVLTALADPVQAAGTNAMLASLGRAGMSFELVE